MDIWDKTFFLLGWHEMKREAAAVTQHFHRLASITATFHARNRAQLCRDVEKDGGCAAGVRPSWVQYSLSTSRGQWGSCFWWPKTCGFSLSGDLLDELGWLQPDQRPHTWLLRNNYKGETQLCRNPWAKRHTFGGLMTTRSAAHLWVCLWVWTLTPPVRFVSHYLSSLQCNF